MKTVHLQKYLSLAGIAVAVAFFYTGYLVETDEEQFHIFSPTTIYLLQGTALLLVLLFFTLSIVFTKRRLQQQRYKKPFLFLLITGLLSLVLPARLFFEWLQQALAPKKEPTVMEAVGRSIGDAIFAHTKKFESLQNTANILFIILGLIILAVLLLAVVNARKKMAAR